MNIKPLSFTVFSISMFLIVSGCSTQDDQQSGSQPLIDYSEISLVELQQEFTITSSDDYIPTWVLNIMVTEDGQILVSQRDDKAIHQFDSEGHHLVQVARAGNGPGELAQYSRAHFNGDILVMSQNGNKVTEYRPDEDGIFAFVKDHEYNPMIRIRDIRSGSEFREAYATTDSVRLPYGTIPPEFTTDFLSVVTFDGDSIAIEEEVLSLKTHSSYVQVSDDGNSMRYSYLPYRYSDSFSALPGNKLLVERPRSSAIQIYNEAIELEYELVLNVKDRPLTEADLDFHFKDLNSSERAERRQLMNDSKPPFMRVMMDDEQRFWLYTDETQNGKEYVILSYSGEPLGRVLLPGNTVLHDISDDKLYMYNRDEAIIEVHSVNLMSS